MSATELRSRSNRAEARMVWFLRRMIRPWDPPDKLGFIVAWDEETVDAFVAAFPEAERTLVVYLMGPNSSPMLNRAANRAKRRGYVVAHSIGNEDARSYNQRTWCRTWRMTEVGLEFLRGLDPLREGRSR